MESSALPRADVSGLLAEASRLTNFEPKLPATFSFRWLGRQFTAAISDAKPQARLKVAANLGSLPFTAESREGRRNLLGLMATPRSAIDIGGFRVSERSRLVFFGEVPVEHPVTGQTILAALVRYLLAAKPYLDLVGELAPRPQRRSFRRR